ncbi:hypothetical protein [Brachybacterium sp. NPDC056505]|uniref:hypothetical protein n=1 Tax=Brachybacterium sp. NPDC056505 TaxID=3345843 RepID=UPI003670DFD3
MELNWASLAPLVLKVLITLGALLCVWATVVIVTRWRDRPSVRRLPHEAVRRRMPVLVPFAGLMIFLFGALIGLVGTTQDADPENGRQMMIAGGAMMLLGIVLLALYVVVYVESTATAFIMRGPLGRTRTIAYEDITSIRRTVSGRMPMIDIRSRTGERIQAGPVFFEWFHYEQWQAERQRRARG